MYFSRPANGVMLSICEKTNSLMPIKHQFRGREGFNIPRMRGKKRRQRHKHDDKNKTKKTTTTARKKKRKKNVLPVNGVRSTTASVPRVHYSAMIAYLDSHCRKSSPGTSREHFLAYTYPFLTTPIMSIAQFAWYKIVLPR
jgi:hypothetical protein